MNAHHTKINKIRHMGPTPMGGSVPGRTESHRLLNNATNPRDFIFVSDTVEGVIRASDNPAARNLKWKSKSPDPAIRSSPWRSLNISNSSLVKLTEHFQALGEALGKKPEIELKQFQLQLGDVPDTYADTIELQTAVEYKSATPVEDGVRQFVDWYRSYYAG